MERRRTREKEKERGGDPPLSLQHLHVTWERDHANFSIHASSSLPPSSPPPLFVFLSLLLLLFFLSLISCYINLREKGGSMCVRKQGKTDVEVEGSKREAYRICICLVSALPSPFSGGPS